MTTVNKEENQEDKRSFLGFFNSTKEENKEGSKEENIDKEENKEENIDKEENKEKNIDKEENKEENKGSFLGFFNSTKEENKNEQESTEVKIPNCESLLKEMRECTRFRPDGTNNCKKEIDEWEKNCKKRWFPIVR